MGWLLAERPISPGGKDSVTAFWSTYLGRSTEEVRLLQYEEINCMLQQQKSELKPQTQLRVYTVIVLNVFKNRIKNNKKKNSYQYEISLINMNPVSKLSLISTFYYSR